MTQQQNYARTAANSFTIIAAETCGFSSCLFAGRTSTRGNNMTVGWPTMWLVSWDGFPLAFSCDRHKPFHRMLIWRAISLQVGSALWRKPPPARTAAFQFHMKPITQLGLLKRLLRNKIGSELWNYSQHSRSHFLPCSFLYSNSLLPSFISSYLSFPLTVSFLLRFLWLLPCIGSVLTGIWWGWYQKARPASHFVLVKETRSAEKKMAVYKVSLILYPSWYLIHSSSTLCSDLSQQLRWEKRRKK